MSNRLGFVARLRSVARLRFVVTYLWATARQERRLGLLALVGLGPGVSFLVAWLHLALALRQAQDTALQQSEATGWLLPRWLLNLLGLDGVLVGVGVVTLLIGCLGLANAYVTSVERRSSDLALLLALGLSRGWLRLLLLLGVALTGAVWPAAQSYLAVAASFALDGRALAVALFAGVLAGLLFMGTTALLGVVVERRPIPCAANSHLRPYTALAGMGDRTLRDALRRAAGPGRGCARAIVDRHRAAGSFLAVALSLLLTGGGWLLTRLYARLPAARFGCAVANGAGWVGPSPATHSRTFLGDDCRFLWGGGGQPGADVRWLACPLCCLGSWGCADGRGGSGVDRG